MRKRLLVVVLFAAVATIGYRVFAPAESVTHASEPYPPATIATPGPRGELPRPPLIVDQRLRVYAAQRRVWADKPITARTETTPFWSLRRWPQQLVGVVDAPGPIVISKWSDGLVVAINARTGTVMWRDPGPVGVREFTGPAAVSSPPELWTGVTGNGDWVVVSSGGNRLSAWSPVSGDPLWTVESPCGTEGFTGPDFYGEVCAGVLRQISLRTGTASASSGARVDLSDAVTASGASPSSRAGVDDEARTGAQPFGCAVGRSRCVGVRSADGAWFFHSGGNPVSAPLLRPAGSWWARSPLVGDLVVRSAADGLSTVAHRLTDGSPQWTWEPPLGSLDRTPARIVAVEPDAIYQITEAGTLVTVDPDTGRELSRTLLERSSVPAGTWRPGLVLARDRYLVVERVGAPGLRPYLLTVS